MTFIEKMKDYYINHGYSYADATRHATADLEYWKAILSGQAL